MTAHNQHVNFAPHLPHITKKPHATKMAAPVLGKDNGERNAMEALSLLERYGINYLDREGNTLLHKVSNSAPVDIYFLANKGVPVNIQNSMGDTALHLAVRKDNIECVQALVQCTADLSVRNGLGLMPVDEAEGPIKELLEKCKCGVLEVLVTGHSKSLSHLMRITWASLETIVKDGKNLLSLASSMCNEKPEMSNCYRILQEFQCTSELIHSVLAEDVQKLKNFFNMHPGFSVNIRFRDQLGKTLLSHAIESNNLEIVQILISAGARINQIRVRDSGRNNDTVPLFFKSLRRNIRPEITQLLHSKLDAHEMQERDTRGNTALLRAIEEGASEHIIGWLLTAEKGYNVYLRNKDSLNARELAKSCGYQEIVNLIDRFILLQRRNFFIVNLPVHFYGMDNLQFKDEERGKTFEEIVVEGDDEDDRKSLLHYKEIENRGTSLFEAAARGDLEQVQRLSVANFQDKNGYTALTRAIVFNQPEVVNYLCTFRPHLKVIPDNCSRYPLHYACSLPDGQDVVLMKILLERNPEQVEKKVDKDGLYPVEYRARRGTHFIDQLLLDARTLDAYGQRGPPIGLWPKGAEPRPTLFED